MGEDAIEGDIIASLPIRQGREARLRPLQIKKYDSAEGRFVGLLPQDRTAH